MPALLWIPVALPRMRRQPYADGKLMKLSLDPTYHCYVTAKAGYKAERYY